MTRLEMMCILNNYLKKQKLLVQNLKNYTKTGNLKSSKNLTPSDFCPLTSYFTSLHLQTFYGVHISGPDSLEADG